MFVLRSLEAHHGALHRAAAMIRSGKQDHIAIEGAVMQAELLHAHLDAAVRALASRLGIRPTVVCAVVLSRCSHAEEELDAAWAAVADWDDVNQGWH
jgi:hypothetical protein